MATNSPENWFHPDIFARKKPYLLARAAALAAFRAEFAARGLIEVDPAALQPVPCAETHIHAVAVTVGGRGGWLHTSPEFACKKLLAAGMERIFYLGKVWRDEQQSSRHLSEFTMAEWYRRGADYTALMADCAALVAAAARAMGSDLLRGAGGTANPFAPLQHLTVQEACLQFAGVDVLRSLDDQGQPNRDILAREAKAADIRIADDDGWGDIFTKVILNVEPHLGQGQLTVLRDYPAPEAALARRKPDDPRVAERFELYACGVELANGFSELTDPAEQRARFVADQALKQQLYGFSYPIDEGLLAALPLMGPAAGVALGFDRLVMLLSGARDIQMVQWTG